jgi:hypothetical protein
LTGREWHSLSAILTREASPVPTFLRAAEQQFSVALLFEQSRTGTFELSLWLAFANCPSAS